MLYATCRMDKTTGAIRFTSRYSSRRTRTNVARQGRGRGAPGERERLGDGGLELVVDRVRLQALPEELGPAELGERRRVLQVAAAAPHAPRDAPVRIVGQALHVLGQLDRVVRAASQMID